MVDAGSLGAGVAGGPIGGVALRRDVYARWPIQQLGVCSASQGEIQAMAQGTGCQTRGSRQFNDSCQVCVPAERSNLCWVKLGPPSTLRLPCSVQFPEGVKVAVEQACTGCRQPGTGASVPVCHSPDKQHAGEGYLLLLQTFGSNPSRQVQTAVCRSCRCTCFQALALTSVSCSGRSSGLHAA